MFFPINLPAIPIQAPAHTPGPWHVDAHTNVMAAGGLVAFPGIAAGFDQKANARLIAAAPALLSALKNARDLLRADGYAAGATMDEIDAAIAKATGAQA